MPYESPIKTKEQAKNFIETFSSSFTEIHSGVEIDLRQIVFRVMDRIGFMLSQNSELFPLQVDYLENLMTPYLDKIYLKDASDLHKLKKEIIKRISAKGKISKMQMKQLKLFLAKEKMRNLSLLFDRMGLYPLREGTLDLTSDDYLKLRDSFKVLYGKTKKDKKENEINESEKNEIGEITEQGNRTESDNQHLE